MFEMLKRQQSLYSSALELEKGLAEQVEKQDFKAIVKNSKSKAANRVEIQKAYEELIPLMNEIRNDDGTMPDDEAEAMRIGIKDTIGEIEIIQQKNLEDISLIKSEMLESIKDTKLAQKAARGYKPSRTRIKAKYDTKS